MKYITGTRDFHLENTAVALGKFDGLHRGHQILIDNIPDVEYHLIDSDFGHDGFLVEHKQLNDIILNFLGE